MKGKKTIWTEQVALNLLRIVAGFLFWQHGAQKLLGFPGGERVGDMLGMMGLAGILEMVGGAMLVLGLFSRPVAFVLSGQMAWAYFSVHAPNGFWPIQNGGELAAFYSFLFLYIAARGGGVFSLDGVRQLRRERKTKEVAPAAEPEAAIPGTAVPDDDFPELTEEDLAEDPEIAELLGDNP
ncbi:MAG: DoxX family protein [Gemmatimonadetes bacterium]|nr:DoxX family protein [Gemmatimonadota bacterium]NNM03526.1 DoxX family protein [Gemmatimonadota bacterium]